MILMRRVWQVSGDTFTLLLFQTLHPGWIWSASIDAGEGWGLWDWLPRARSGTGVLQLCCSTQLEAPYAASLSCWVAAPPTHTGVCMHVCVLHTVAIVYTLTTQTTRMSSFLKFAWTYTNHFNLDAPPSKKTLLIYTQIWVSLLLWLEARRYLGGWHTTANSNKICAYE